MKRLVVATVGTVMVIAACQWDPYGPEYTRAKPAAADLVGSYKLDEETRTWLSREIAAPLPSSKLTLRADGSFELADIPDCWHEWKQCSSATEQAGGRWELVEWKEQPGQWSFVLDVQYRSVPDARKEFREIDLRGQAPPYKVHFGVRDPDEGRALAFEKYGG